MGATLTQIVEIFRGAGGVADAIIVAYRTRQGDLILHTATLEVRDNLEQIEGWTKRVCKSVKVLRKTTPVIVHNIRIAAIDEKDQGAAIEALKGTNRVLHLQLDIAKVEWPPGAHKKNNNGGDKRFSSLIVEVTSPEAANRLINEGLAFEGSISFCDSWVRNSTVQQCFNYYGYGHIVRVCKNLTRCGYCAGNHLSQAHQKDSTRVKYAIYGGNHPAWGRDCPIRQKEATKMKAKWETKAKYYKVPERRTTPLPVIRFTTGSPDAEGFRIVTNKRKALADITDRAQGTNTTKKGPGRPTKLSTLE